MRTDIKRKTHSSQKESENSEEYDQPNLNRKQKEKSVSAFSQISRIDLDDLGESNFYP